jgi:hypothetical protein
LSAALLAACLLSAGCGQQAPPKRPPAGSTGAGVSRPAVSVGAASRPAPPAAPQSYHGAVIRGYRNARERIREAELRRCFQVGLALRHGREPKNAEQVRQVLADGGYPLSQLPAGYAVTYDPERRQVFLLRQGAP